jgi:hypothetical protein
MATTITARSTATPVSGALRRGARVIADVGLPKPPPPGRGMIGCRIYRCRRSNRGPYRIFFYSHDLREPPHVHVERDRSIAKFWLQPVALSSSHGFAAHELNEIHGIVRDNVSLYLEKWNEHLGKSK